MPRLSHTRNTHPRPHCPPDFRPAGIATLNNWVAVEMSDDGSTIVAAIHGGGLYYTSNYGLRWSGLAVGNRPWSFVTAAGTKWWAGTDDADTEGGALWVWQLPHWVSPCLTPFSALCHPHTAPACPTSCRLGADWCACNPMVSDSRRQGSFGSEAAAWNWNELEGTRGQLPDTIPHETRSWRSGVTNAAGTSLFLITAGDVLCI